MAAMLNKEFSQTLKRLRNRYRLVVMNDDTYEEVVTFKLTRMSVYIMLSTIFVVLVSFTAALIIFTPLKYYIPGAGGDYQSVMALKHLQYRIDSVEKQDAYKNQYIFGLKKALSGGGTENLDTMTLVMPPAEQTND